MYNSSQKFPQPQCIDGGHYGHYFYSLLIRKKFLILITLFLSLVGCSHSHHYSNNQTIATFNYTYSWNCTWDSTNRVDTILVYTPTAPGNYPTMIFHHGRGFDYTDYNDVFTRISAGGVIITSVTDDISFISRTSSLANPNYDHLNVNAGMESASYAQIESLNQALTLNKDPNSLLFKKIDISAIYIAGHSRRWGYFMESI